jgi:hypothetical protein
MGVLSMVAGSVAAAYVAPRLTEFAWSNAFTWFGKTIATWAVVAVLWDLLANNGDGRDFTNEDFVISALVALGIRVVV